MEQSKYDMLRERGLAHLRDLDLDEAARIFEQILTEGGSDSFSYAILGAIYRRQEKYGEAATYYNLFIGLEPENAKALVHLADCYQHLGNFRAEGYVSLRALQADRSCEDALNMLVEAATALRKETEGEVLCRAALDVDPDNPALHAMMAIIYEERQAWEMAADHYASAARNYFAGTDDWAMMRFRQGNCLVRLGRFEEAIEFFWAVNEVDADHDGLPRALAKCLIILGKFEDARFIVEKLMDEGPDDPLHVFIMQLVYRKTGDTELADEYSTPVVEDLRTYLALDGAPAIDYGETVM